MYYEGRGVPQDFKQALVWYEKAAAQDLPDALAQLGSLYCHGEGVLPSWRRAREYWHRAIQLGDSTARKEMDDLTRSIQEVTSPIMKT